MALEMGNWVFFSWHMVFFRQALWDAMFRDMGSFAPVTWAVLVCFFSNKNDESYMRKSGP